MTAPQQGDPAAALFDVPPSRHAHAAEPTGRRSTRKPPPTARSVWAPYAVARRSPCMACTRDQRDGTTTAAARQARWELRIPGGRSLLVCSEHKQEAVDGGL